MKKSLMGLCHVLFLSVLFFSCSSAKKVSEKTESYQPWENALLWEISGPSLKAPSYVFGTVHLIDKDDFFLPSGTLEALEKSDEIVFEIDLAEMSDLSSQMGLLTKAFMKDNITLRDLITQEEYDEVDRFFKELGLPLFFFERMKPMFLSVMASMDGDMGTLQSEMTSYEFELMDLAKAKNMPSAGLETLDFQISLFDSIPYEEQAHMLLESIRSRDQNAEGFDALVKMYKAQDINGMLHSMDEEGIKDYEHLLLTKRNINWIPEMVGHMKKNPTLFAVGAGHLAGERGVLWLLKQEGYQVKPISHGPH